MKLSARPEPVEVSECPNPLSFVSTISGLVWLVMVTSLAEGVSYRISFMPVPARFAMLMAPRAGPAPVTPRIEKPVMLAKVVAGRRGRDAVAHDDLVAGANGSSGGGRQRGHLGGRRAADVEDVKAGAELDCGERESAAGAGVVEEAKVAAEQPDRVAPPKQTHWC